MVETQFVNLTRGLLCPHIRGGDPTVRFVRIQSTHCEQKRWGDILTSLGAEFYTAAILGPVVVHDRSEKPRPTRATWQGLSWIRYAVRRTWWDDTRTPEYARSGHMLNGYWDECYRALSKRERNAVRYYRRYAESGDPAALSIRGCGGMVEEG